MIITVASGKGGTGKTTVAVNLAVTAAKQIISANKIRSSEKSGGFLDYDKVELLDCDVEEPNAHLFFKPENIISKEVSTMIPEVEADICSLCTECEKICQFSAIAMIAKKIMVFPEMCHSCKGCSMVCPTGAIKESGRLLGYIHKGGINKKDNSFLNQNPISSSINKNDDKGYNFTLSWGELRVGEAMSPPLIKHVKKQIYKLDASSLDSSLNDCKIKPLIEQKSLNNLTIIDAPPGTSCPAVTTLKDSDFALLVTEETPFGLNDLALTVEVLKKLDVPMGIVINRADDCIIETDSDNFHNQSSNRAVFQDKNKIKSMERIGIIDNYAAKENIEILQRLPFSRQAASVCSKGLLLTEEMPEMQMLFDELYLKIMNKIKRSEK